MNCSHALKDYVKYQYKLNSIRRSKVKCSLIPYDKFILQQARRVVRDEVELDSIRFPKRWSKARRKEYNKLPWRSDIREKCNTVALSDAIAPEILKLVKEAVHERVIQEATNT